MCSVTNSDPLLGSFVFPEWFDAARSVAHSVLPKEKADELVKGLPEKPTGEIDYKIKVDVSKEQRILGLKYRTKEETVKGILEQGVRDGWF